MVATLPTCPDQLNRYFRYGNGAGVRLFAILFALTAFATFPMDWTR